MLIHLRRPTLNNRRQSVGLKPDSRPRLEGVRYKYLTSCSPLLNPSSSFSSVTQEHRPRLEGLRYRYLTSCSRLLSPSSSFSHTRTQATPRRGTLQVPDKLLTPTEPFLVLQSRTRTHQPDSSPPGLAQWACHKRPQRVGPE